MDEAVRIQDEFYILATQSRADERTRVLKQGETFAVFDRFGDLPATPATEYGLYHGGTRYLSRCDLRISGQHALLLSSTIRKAEPVLTADLTTPDVAAADGSLLLPKGVLHIFRSKFLWDGTCYEQLEVSNFSGEPIHALITLQMEADFADIFEVRGTPRERRGRRLPNEVSEGTLILSYRGLDDVVRRTTISCQPQPTSIHDGTLRLAFGLGPGESTSFEISIACEIGETRRSAVPYRSAGTIRDDVTAQTSRSAVSRDQLERRVQPVADQVVRRHHDDDDRTPRRAVPVRGRAVVQHAVRP